MKPVAADKLVVSLLGELNQREEDVQHCVRLCWETCMEKDVKQMNVRWLTGIIAYQRLPILLET